MRIWPRSQTWRALLIVALLLAAIAVLFLVLVDDWSDRGIFRDWADIVQSIVTILAIIVGGVFALFKLQTFRDFEPHLTITHKVSHRMISENYIQIVVTAILHNSSKVQIELNKGFFRLQRIAPQSDQDVEEFYSQVFIDRKHEDIQWPIMEEVRRSWDKRELIVEPGESHPETYEFIVLRDVQAVLIYTYFYNPKFILGAGNAEGWHATTVHDIFEIDSSGYSSPIR